MIKTQAQINQSIEKVWEFWTKPEHIIHWNFASDDWHCPKAKNDFEIGGNFCYTMASKDTKMSFDFEGQFTFVENIKRIEYTMTDGRKAIITFENNANNVELIQKFEAEKTNPEEAQKNGWQSILENFKTYSENNN